MDRIVKQDTWAIRARYLFPVDGPPIRDGVLSCTGTRIAAVGDNTSAESPRDLGNVAVVPGFVNAHTHLEFSDLEQPLGHPGMRLPEWIREVVLHRRQLPLDADEAAQCSLSAISKGLSESYRAGVTSLGEIATRDWLSEFPETPLQCTLFREQIALPAARLQAAFDGITSWLARTHTAPRAWQPAISPHAPYTVHPELLRRLCELSLQQRVPLAMHLAESPEELELLASHSGAFVPLLSELGAWDPAAIPRGIQPLDYLRRLATAHRALVIHGNYLDTEEIEFLAGQAASMSVVFCPRTHAYFRHGRYPLGELLRAGVRVALGTDSRASNPDLSLFEELRFVFERCPDIAPVDVLRLGTIAGARALGTECHTGSLAAGKRADFAVLSIPDEEPADLHELLFHSTARVTAVCASGQFRAQLGAGDAPRGLN